MRWKIFEDKFGENSTTGFIIEPGSYSSITRHRLEFGDGHSSIRSDAIARIDIKKIKNFQIQIDLKMIDDAGNPLNWFGIKPRSTNNQLQDGYLVYVRSNGEMAIYTGGSNIPNSANQITSSLIGRRITLLITLEDSKFTVKVEGNEFVYTDPNRTLHEGLLYLYANKTKNKIYKVTVWKVFGIKVGEILKNILWGKASFIFYPVMLFLFAFLLYQFNPMLINNILASKLFQFWSAIK